MKINLIIICIYWIKINICIIHDHLNILRYIVYLMIIINEYNEYNKFTRLHRHYKIKSLKTHTRPNSCSQKYNQF